MIPYDFYTLLFHLLQLHQPSIWCLLPCLLVCRCHEELYQVTQHRLLNSPCSPACNEPFVVKQVTLYVQVYYWAFYSTPLFSFSILATLPWYLSYFIIGINTLWYSFFSCVFFFKSSLYLFLPQTLHYHMNLRSQLLTHYMLTHTLSLWSPSIGALAESCLRQVERF